MAVRDFTANQIRTAKVIMTGSSPSGGISHKKLELSIYSESVATDQIGGDPANIYTNVGDDVTIFVSGSQTSRGGAIGGTTLFQGDTYVSGTLVVKNEGRTYASISGSIQKMADGTDYIRVVGGLVATSGSDGSITLDASGVSGGGDVSLDYYDESSAPNPTAPLAAGPKTVVIGTNSLADTTSTYSLIFGTNNTGSFVDVSVIGGGADNKIQNVGTAGRYAKGIVISGGGSNIVTGSSQYSTIGGGFQNLMTGSTTTDVSSGFNTIGGGSSNLISGSYNTIAGGTENKIQNNINGKFFIGGGFRNIGSSEQGAIAGGSTNSIDAFSDFSFIGSGQDNKISGSNGTANAHYSVIGGGSFNKIAASIDLTSVHSAILGGKENKIDRSEQSSILGGGFNLIKPSHNVTMLMGQHLTSSDKGQVILGYGSTFTGAPHGGYVVASGSYFKSDGLSGGAITGSITRTSGDVSYLVAAGGIAISSASNGQITIDGSGITGGNSGEYYSFEGPNMISSGSYAVPAAEWGARYHRATENDVINPVISNFAAYGPVAHFDHNYDEKPAALLIRSRIPQGASQLQITIDFKPIHTGVNGVVQLMYAGRLFKAGTTLRADATANAGSWHNSGLKWLTHSTTTVTSVNNYNVSNSATNITSFISSVDSSIAAGNILDIAICRNQSSSASDEIGTSTDTFANDVKLFGIFLTYT